MQEPSQAEEDKIAELRLKLRALYRRNQLPMHQRVLALHDRLKSRYPNFRRYRLFHLISGSTANPPYADFDFPGDDSIETFIEREYEEAFSET